MITNKFLFYRLKANFESDLNAGDISRESIVFIDETRLIWTHGGYYGGNNAAYVRPPGKFSPELEWSAESASVVIGGQNTYPTLDNPDNVSPITYSSSDTAVATINATGQITLVSPGTTTIKATFAGNDFYYTDEVSYTLTVTGNVIHLWYATAEEFNADMFTGNAVTANTTNTIDTDDGDYIFVKIDKGHTFDITYTNFPIGFSKTKLDIADNDYDYYKCDAGGNEPFALYSHNVNITIH